MAFDWKDFAAAFLEGTAENIERRGEEARAYKEEQKAAATRNAELIRNRAAKAKEAASYARKAKAYLGSHDDADLMVRAAMSAGPTEIITLYQKLEAAANQPGQNGKLGEADIDALINMPELPGSR
jgi:ATP-dependent exoDNAse (exonuclease V) alpha subunit